MISCSSIKEIDLTNPARSRDILRVQKSAYRREGDKVGICRLAVHLEYSWQRIATCLIRHLEQTEMSYKRIVVPTAKRNIPAKKLYLKNGFFKAEERKTEDGLDLVIFEKIVPGE